MQLEGAQLREVGRKEEGTWGEECLSWARRRSLQEAKSGRAVRSSSQHSRISS